MQTIDLVRPISDVEPYEHQVRGANELVQNIVNGARRQILVAPTGSGKTLTSKLLTLSRPLRGHLSVPDGEKLRVLFIANKHRLNRQALETYDDVSDAVELVVHSAFSQIPQKVIDQGWHMCIIDEAHHEAMMSIQLILARLAERPIVGLTADDSRGDGKLLKFEKRVCPISEAEAAHLGFIEKVGVNSIIDIGKRDRSALACDLVTQYHPHMGNTIAFFKTNDEAQRFHNHLRQIGLTSMYLSTTSTENDMDNALEALSLGEAQFIVNCHKIGEGVDVHQCTDVLLARHFYTESEKRQYIGRAIRNDSPCAAWEFINPLRDTVTAKQVVGATKYERIIYKQGGGWHEKMFEGEDPTWGQMSRLRKSPENPNPTWSRPERGKTQKAAPAPLPEARAASRQGAGSPFPTSLVRRRAPDSSYSPSM